MPIIQVLYFSQFFQRFSYFFFIFIFWYFWWFFDIYNCSTIKFSGLLVVEFIAGRVLVGLRWWNEIKKYGTKIWVFESENEKKERLIDTSIFWRSINVAPLFWGVFIILEIIGRDLVVSIMCNKFYIQFF